jgi:ribosomal protein S18 acetylase RimI-like enzyme
MIASEPSPAPSIDRQDFESGILGRPVYRLTLPPPPRSSTLVGPLAVVRERLTREGVGLIACRIKAGDAEAAAALEAAGFRRIECLVTLSRPLGVPREMPPGTGLAMPADHESCLAIGRTAFTFDRFHADDRFPDEAADRLKEAWVRNSFAGRADACLVSRDGATAVGFVMCRFSQGQPAIDLIAVALSHQARGHGRRLVAAAMAHYAPNYATISVATQQSNLPSMALYRALGFAVIGTELTYHWVP